MTSPSPTRVLEVWLGARDADGLSSQAQAARWFKFDPAFDEALRGEFLELWNAMMAGEHKTWLDSPDGRLAYVIVLDQFSRNMFRRTPDMFAADALALSAAVEGVRRGHDQALTGHARVFMYMPFMHSEELAMQDECVRLFTTFRDQSQGRMREALEGNVKFAIQHRDIIARWGRFPHRNALLDRTSTGEELAFLELPGSSF